MMPPVINLGALMMLPPIKQGLMRPNFLPKNPQFPPQNSYPKIPNSHPKIPNSRPKNPEFPPKNRQIPTQNQPWDNPGQGQGQEITEIGDFSANLDPFSLLFCVEIGPFLWFDPELGHFFSFLTLRFAPFCFWPKIPWNWG